MPIRKISLSEQARDELLNAIITGRYPAGTRLTEEALSAEYCISRTPIRDAMTRLAADGLLERLPRGGFQVKILDIKTVQELFACRMDVELFILTSNYPALDLAQLHELYRELDSVDPAAAEAFEHFRKIDDTLHGLIRDSADNSYWRGIHDRLLQQRLPYRDFRNAGRAGSNQLKAERLHLISELASGDLKRAAAALSAHLESGLRDIIQAMQHENMEQE